MIRIVSSSNRKATSALLSAARVRDRETEARAAEIVDGVRTGGDRALRGYAKRLDALQGALEVPRAEWERQARSVAPEVRRAIRDAASRIRRVARAQVPKGWRLNVAPGAIVEQRVVPLERVGCYVPAGRHPLPSSLLMTAIPARAAGVGEVIVGCPRPEPPCSPPPSRPASIALFRLGGAHAIAALAYGTAHRAARGQDRRTGQPLGLGGQGARQRRLRDRFLRRARPRSSSSRRRTPPAWIAADLIAQAEHDPDARAVLHHAEPHAGGTRRPRGRRSAASRRTGPRRRWRAHGGIIVTAVGRRSDRRWPTPAAPEHLVVDERRRGRATCERGLGVRRAVDGAGGRRLRDRFEPRAADRGRRTRPRRPVRRRLRAADHGAAADRAGLRRIGEQRHRRWRAPKGLEGARRSIDRSESIGLNRSRIEASRPQPGAHVMIIQGFPDRSRAAAAPEREHRWLLAARARGHPQRSRAERLATLSRTTRRRSTSGCVLRRRPGLGAPDQRARRGHPDGVGRLPGPTCAARARRAGAPDVRIREPESSSRCRHSTRTPTARAWARDRVGAARARFRVSGRRGARAPSRRTRALIYPEHPEQPDGPADSAGRHPARAPRPRHAIVLVDEAYTSSAARRSSPKRATYPERAGRPDVLQGVRPGRHARRRPHRAARRARPGAGGACCPSTSTAWPWPRCSRRSRTAEFLPWYAARSTQSKALLYARVRPARPALLAERGELRAGRVGDRRRSSSTGMIARGVHVRDRSKDPATPGCIRITAGVVEHTRAAVEALEAVCARRGNRAATPRETQIRLR